ncbi:MAG: hypothetical protein IPL49_05175 [Saprospirales bacterium]|nr:hypothetical protein [Saprospirales bacterium]
MRNAFLILACFLLHVSVFSQPISSDLLKGLKIRNIGPGGMSGRVTTIDVDLSNPDRIFVGTASGGVWKSESGGATWEPVFEEAPLQAIGALTINQRNPSEIWVGTGEGNPRNSLNSGEGIFKSLDGGRTWNCMGLKGTRLIHRILIHRDNPDVVIVGALGSAWGPGEDRGVYKTTDGGKTWRKVLYVNPETGCGDLVVDPSNPNKLIAAMWEFGRKPWTFNSGGPGSGIFVSFDGGETWTRRTDKDGLPEGILGRVGLAIAPSEPSIVYALVEAKENALFKSTDGGFTWKKIADKNIGNRPFYYADIFVDPKNENRVFNLFSSVTVSQDGGHTFDDLLPSGGFGGIHPDHHAFWIHPDDPKFIMEGNDGGLYISRDGGSHWQFVNNLPVGQFYHISYDMSIPYQVGGGMQDNGSWIGPSSVWQRGGIQNHEWQEIYFGDGFDVVFKPGDPRHAYAMSQGGNVAYIDRETGKSYPITPQHPDGIPLRFNWNAGIAQDPFHDCGVYFGSQFLHKSMDCGQTWTILSPDLTTNDSTKQKQYESGGLTIDDTEAENFTTILSIAPSSLDENIIWVGTDDGNLQLTRDGGRTWANLASRLPDCPEGSWIPQIRASTYSAGEAFVVVNNYRRNDWRPMVYFTNDFGASFRRIADEKKISGHALSIIQDPEVPNLLWMGTDYGLYVSIDFGATWTQWKNGFPSVSTADLAIHPRDGDLLVATFGRSVWILDDIRPFRELARTKGKVLEQDFAVFDAPDAYLAEYRSVDGTRFIADAVFVGENRPSGALLTYWVKPPVKAEAKEDPKNGKGGRDKKDRIKVRVIDESGDTIRTFSIRPDTGMVRFTWDMRRDGVRFPRAMNRWGGREQENEDELPAGIEVFPGTYKLVFSYKKAVDSTQVRVWPDPRIPYDIEVEKTRKGAVDNFYQLVEVATKSLNQLKEAQKTLALVNQTLVNAPDSTQKIFKDKAKVLGDSLKTLVELYNEPEDLKGIQRGSDNISAYLFRTLRYLRDNPQGSPNQMAQISQKQAEKALSQALERINRFFAEDWAQYQRDVEALDVSLFKPVEQLRME